MPEEYQSSIPNKRTIPVQPIERIDFVDILRGFAVFGILIANMASYSGHTTDLQAPINSIDHLILVLVRFFVTAKFYSLFSFLFGWGMAVQMSRAAKKGKSFGPLYLRRLFILLLIGIAHGIFIWIGDILTLYALLGVLLLALRNRSEKVLLAGVILSLLFAILIRAPGETMTAFRAWYEELTSFMRSDTFPESLYTTGTYLEITKLRLQEYLNGQSWTLYYFGNIFGMFLLGLYVGKRRIFQEVGNYLPLVRKTVWVGLLVGAISHGLYVWMSINSSWLPASWIPPEYNQMIQRFFYTVGAPALMLFYVSGIILMLRKANWHRQLAPLGNVGRMALSNYLLQSIVATLIFYNYGLGLYGQISPTIGLILTVVLFLVQIRISEWWFDRYRFGPMEMFWRTLTYGKLQPIHPGGTSAGRKQPSLLLRVNNLTENINPIIGLISVWFFLLIWAGALFAWYIRLDAKSSSAPAQVVVKATATPSLGSTTPDEVQEVTANTAHTLSKVKPVVYNPSPIAATGDVLALAASFDVDRALLQIKTLTGTPYLGRQAGSPEGWATGDYLAGQFENFGLQPIGDNGTFFQNFKVTYTPLADTPTFRIEDPDGTIHNEYKIYHDFSPIVRWYAGEGETMSEVFWVNECNQDNFSEADVVGKVVLCETDTRTNWMMDSTRNAIEHGASGLLFIGDSLARSPDFASPFKDIWVPETVPTFWVYPKIVEALLAGSEISISDLDTAEKVLPLRTKVNLNVTIKDIGSCPGTECEGRNILGVLPGRDPNFANEVVILGAHYDHMGQGPDGTIWRGANDNASGVAVLLEIAQSWQEQGYVPRRTVVFAAWDAEEIGLIGSRHYVDFPSYPLENTLAMVQLDMVGAGTESLNVDGHPSLSLHIQRVAEAIEVSTTISNNGRSDHAPFLEAGVPASMLIWFGDETYEHYHRPADTIDVIDPQKLEEVANITEVTLLDIVESVPAITDMLSQRAIAAEMGNLEMFLSTSQFEQEESDRIWYADLRSLSPTRVKLESHDLQVTGDMANASVRINVEYLEEGPEVITNTLTTTIPVQFARDSSGWKWSGPHLAWSEETNPEDMPLIEVAYPPGNNTGISGLSQIASEEFTEISQLLGLPINVDAKLLLLPDKEALQASTALSLPENLSLWVGPGMVKLVYSEEISKSLQIQEAMAKLVLAEAGVNEKVAPWLWEGLPLALRTRTEPIAMQERYLPNLQKELSSEELGNSHAIAWATTHYLQKRLGWNDLGKFISLLGQICQEGGCTDSTGLDSALLETSQLDSEGFETAWQSHWKMQLVRAQANLNQVLSTRSIATLNLDETGFLSTVDLNVPNLLKEERGWFADLREHPIGNFSQEAQPLALLEDGSILARVKLMYSFDGEISADETEKSTILKILFTPNDSGYRWAGPYLSNLQGDLVDIRYPEGEENLAEKMQLRAEITYLQLATLFEIENPEKVTITLYKNADNYRSSIFLSYPNTITASAWTEPGGSIKFQLISNKSVEEYAQLLTTQLSRNLLFQTGVDSEWLLSGISAYLSSSFDGGTFQKEISAQLGNLLEASQEDHLTRLTDIPPNHKIPEDDYELVQSQAWDAVNYLINTYGWEALVDILHIQRRGANLQEAMRTSLGRPIDDFEEDWKKSLAQGHILQDSVNTAQAFDQEIAMEHVEYLASPDLAGRQAGSPGDITAAAYITEKFKAYGLVPAGDQIVIESQPGSAPISTQEPLNVSEPISVFTETITMYYQHFPISYTLPLFDPELELINKVSESVIAFQYRQDFLDILPTINNNNKTVIGELVWIGDEGYQGVNLDGKIALRNPSSDLLEEIAKAMEHGAEGLIIAGIKRENNDLFAKYPLVNAQTSSETIPVYELTLEGYRGLLEIIGLSRNDLGDLHGVHPLGHNIRLKYHFIPPQNVNTANILGLLPGSDLFLSQETIIIGAHYDHVGDDLNGVRYSGANDDASGIGVLLEIARLWHQIGYQPKRNVLFAAWGAQEMGELGSKYFIEHPTLPLEHTKAMIQMDGVGGGDGFNLGAQGLWEQDGLILFHLGAAGNALGEKVIVTQSQGESDHIPFRHAGLPALLLTWRLANEDNLPDNLANNVNPERLGVSGRIATLLLMNLIR